MNADGRAFEGWIAMRLRFELRSALARIVGAMATSCYGRFVHSRAANLSIVMALSLLPLVGAIGFAIDYTNVLREKNELQALLDAALLGGAAQGATSAEATATSLFSGFIAGSPDFAADPDLKANMSIKLDNSTLSGSATYSYPRLFPFVLGDPTVNVRVTSAVKMATSAVPCIIVLANNPQALLLNSGANVNAESCVIDVHSTRDPAFIMNAGVTMNISKLCVKGTKYIKNGGTLSKLETACAVTADPYAGAIPEPAVPSTCTTSGAHDGQTQTLNPGLHCWVNFNGSPTITFNPGLHIIKGPMIINSGAKVIAEGVTFYFPDTDSMIQANGALTITASAPSSGAYKDILMLEKTSDPANNANKRQYVFNGSNGESLTGIIYLPNRDVTYNSTTNITSSKISMVVNTMIINSANWKFSGIAGQSAKIYLSQ
ncbi:MAG: pilus assembly protein [Mesorhizobium sp.]|nr:MAG: pilus assembly protein [Mesorhizobium sp.]